MTNHNEEIIERAFTVAALLGVAGFLYHLWSTGVSIPNLLVVLGMAIFAAAIAAAVVAMAFRRKEE